MSFSKVTIYFEHGLSGLVASSTKSGYDVANLLDRMTRTLYMGDTTSPITIKFDAGLGNTYAADSLRISRHNLKTVGATLALQYSTDDATYYDAFTPYVPGNDKTLAKEFTSQDKRYWQLKLSGMTDKPFMAMCEWGLFTLLGWHKGKLDPHSTNDKEKVITSPKGDLLEIVPGYKERNLPFKFMMSLADYTAKIEKFYDEVDLLNCVVAWEKGGRPADVWLVRRKPGRRYNPFEKGSQRRTVSLPFIGKVEV